jgi:hypothetical protein
MVAGVVVVGAAAGGLPKNMWWWWGGGVVAGVPDGGGISELREPHRPKDDCFIAFKMFSFHTTLAHGDVLIHFKNRKTHDKFFGVHFF